MQQQSVNIYRGETIAMTWTLAPVQDITGWTFLLTFSKGQNSAQKVLQVAPAVVSGPAGTFGYTLTSAQSAVLPPGTYAWDVWRNDVGQERLLAFGVVAILANARFP